MIRRDSEESNVREIKANCLVIGDVIKLKVGDFIPADCIIIDPSTLYIKVEENGEYLTKGIYGDDVKNRVLRYRSKILAGQCTAVVFKVGIDKQRGDELLREVNKIPQIKLELDDWTNKFYKFA